jgi:hypothetical protein
MMKCEISFDSSRKAFAKGSVSDSPFEKWKIKRETSNRIFVKMSGRSGRATLLAKNRNISVTICDYSVPAHKRKKLFKFVVFFNQEGQSYHFEIDGTLENRFYPSNRPLEEISEAITAADKYYSTSIDEVNYKQPFHENKPLFDDLMQQIEALKVPIP